MRLTLIIFTVLGLFFSCNSNDTNKVSIDSTAKKLQRKFLIEELKRIQTVFASKDKEKIADIFQFPLSDTTVGIHIDDSTFNSLFKKNGDKTTREMFLRFFPQISESLKIGEINQLFENIKLDSLELKDTLKYDAYIKTEPCYDFYEIAVEQDFLTLSTGMAVNDY